MEGLGEIDRADRFFVRAGAVFKRLRDGLGGGARGAMNLSAGFMVILFSVASEVSEALRYRRG